MRCSDGKYWWKLVSIQYRYFWVWILVSILRYPFENPHHELHIHKFATYFDIFQLLGFEFFQNFWVSSTFAPFWVISFKFCFFGGAFLVTIPVTIQSIDTKIRYRHSMIPKGIHTVSILFRTTTLRHVAQFVAYASRREGVAPCLGLLLPKAAVTSERECVMRKRCDHLM